MRRGTLLLLLFIVLLALGAGYVLFWPNHPLYGLNNPFTIKEGLDLQGGHEVCGHGSLLLELGTCGCSVRGWVPATIGLRCHPGRAPAPPPAAADVSRRLQRRPCPRAVKTCR